MKKSIINNRPLSTKNSSQILKDDTKKINHSKQEIFDDINLTNLKEFSKEDLLTIHNQLEFINIQIQNTFQKQKEASEKILFERVNEIIKLREYIFNINSKLNNKVNISEIENYLSINYSKILQITPKINNLLENIDDIKINLNYGMDRIYLEDNLVCDEKEFLENINKSVIALDKLGKDSSANLNQIDSVKENYQNYFKQIKILHEKMNLLNNLIKKEKDNKLEETVKNITISLTKENINLENDIFN